MSQYLVDPRDVALEERVATLKGEEAHHLLRVSRARAGERVRLSDGRGRRWEGAFEAASGGEARITGLVGLPSNEPPFPVHLLQGLIKGDRWEWLLEKAVELGVTRITPLVTEHTVARPGENAAKHKRWEKIIEAAAKQSERGSIPRLDQPAPFCEAVDSLPAPEEREARLLLAERTDAPRADRVGGPLLLAVGPEGGFSASEREALLGRGFRPVTLGPRILRSETAALAALACAAPGS